MNKTYSNNLYPDHMMGAMLSSIEEVIGRNSLNAVLDQATLSGFYDGNSDPDNGKASSLRPLSLLQKNLEQAYGHRGGQGLALRAGRIFFNHSMRLYGEHLGLTSNTFLMQILQQKIQFTLQAMAGLLNRFSDHNVVIEEFESNILWRVQGCPFCWERKEHDPICHFTIGLLQEAMYWVSGGKIYRVEETTCLACGDPECLIVINLTPFL